MKGKECADMLHIITNSKLFTGTTPTILTICVLSTLLYQLYIP